MSHDRLADNPFFVLELGADATATEIEREGRRLLAQLEMGLGSVAHYPTPLGPRPRTPEKVRLALSRLLDPAVRLVDELWATAQPGDLPVGPGPWPDALTRLGWRQPSRR
ncbi:MAG: hypothetical protein AAF602_18320 [Myxococcota bacterium]